MSNTTAPLILIVEDQPDHAQLIREMLEKDGAFRTDVAISLTEAIDYVDENHQSIALLVVDLDLGDSGEGLGYSLLGKANGYTPRIPVVILSQRVDEKNDDDPNSLAALHGGAMASFQKFPKASIFRMKILNIVQSSGRTSMNKEIYSLPNDCNYNPEANVLEGPNFDPYFMGKRSAQIFEALAKTPGQMISAKEILRSVYGHYSKEKTNVRERIWALRKAIEKRKIPLIIETVGGQGYSNTGYRLIGKGGANE